MGIGMVVRTKLLAKKKRLFWYGPFWGRRRHAEEQEPWRMQHLLHEEEVRIIFRKQLSIIVARFSHCFSCLNIGKIESE
jgi:hypothetical protein